MTATSIIMMLIAIAIVWGGLAISIVHLLKHPEGSVELLDDNGRPIVNQD